MKPADTFMSYAWENEVMVFGHIEIASGVVQ